MNMREWFEELKASEVKKPIPVLSFPSIQLLGINVNELISSSENQAEGMRRIAERVDAWASVSMMDLSVEAEAFGSTIRYSDEEVPTVFGRIVASASDAQELEVPSVEGARTGLYVKAIEIAAKTIKDRPVFAGTIGPFSLAGRLMDVSEAIMNCYDDPDMVHTVLKKVKQFLIEYIKRYKAVGANGVVIAEPLAGLLSPPLIEEFSTPYCRQIVDAVQDDNFAVIYHNCGNQTVQLAESIVRVGAMAYHFGNAIDMEKMLETLPEGTITLGNIDPSSQFRNGTPESIREATLALLNKCSRFKSFIISSGCDIPPLSSWDNIDAFFAATKEFYGN